MSKCGQRRKPSPCRDHDYDRTVGREMRLANIILTVHTPYVIFVECCTIEGRRLEAMRQDAQQRIEARIRAAGHDAWTQAPFNSSARRQLI
jgi:hypothetical protein